MVFVAFTTIYIYIYIYVLESRRRGVFSRCFYLLTGISAPAHRVISFETWGWMHKYIRGDHLEMYRNLCWEYWIRPPFCFISLVLSRFTRVLKIFQKLVRFSTDLMNNTESLIYLSINLSICCIPVVKYTYSYI